MRLQGAQGNDADNQAEAGSRPADVLDGIAAGVDLAFGRRHVNGVVLLNVIIGGLEEVLAAEVHGGDLAASVGFTDQGDVPVAVDVQVSGAAEGFQNRQALAVHVVGARGGHFTQDGELEVGDLDVDGGVADVVPVPQGGGNFIPQPGAGLAGRLDLSDDRQDDVAVGVHQVTLS